MKNCKKISLNKKRNASNKVYKYCHKTFLKKSNRDRHVKQFYENSNNTTCEDVIELNVNDGEIDEEFPIMVWIGSNNVEFNVNEIFDHVINIGDMFFRGNYLKLVRSRKSNMKQFQVIGGEVLLSSDEINIFIEINDDLQSNVNIYNGLIHKAQLWIPFFVVEKTGINDTSDAPVYVKLFLKR